MSAEIAIINRETVTETTAGKWLSAFMRRGATIAA